MIVDALREDSKRLTEIALKSQSPIGIILKSLLRVGEVT